MEKTEKLDETFRSMIHLITGIPLNRITPASQGGPPVEGEALYATYDFAPVRVYGRGSKSYEEIEPIEPVSIAGVKDLNEIVRSSMSLVLSVNFINKGAVDAAMRLHSADKHYSVTEFLHKNDIAWRYVSDVRNLTDLNQTDAQPKFQADIHLFIEHTTTYAVLQALGFSTINFQ